MLHIEGMNILCFKLNVQRMAPNLGGIMMEHLLKHLIDISFTWNFDRSLVGIKEEEHLYQSLKDKQHLAFKL